MPGKIVALMVEAGGQVKLGTPLIVLEAMKMEHTITAPADGRVVSFPFKQGDMVSEGDALLVFEPGDAGP
jgi:3-methylcrotonyl-CoA carboxylase alpha subunit